MYSTGSSQDSKLGRAWYEGYGTSVTQYLLCLKVSRRVIVVKQPPHISLQYLMAIGCKLAIVLHTLQPPPGSVPAVVTGVGAPAQQVRDQPMAQASSKREQCIPVCVR